MEIQVWLAIAALTTALLWDALVGDPPWLPHPVRLIGTAIHQLERLLHRGQSATAQRWAGLVLLLCIVLLCGGLSFGALALAACVSPWLAWLFCVPMVGIALASKSLADAALLVITPLERGDLAEARHKLSWIVGRDTEQLDSSEICRATIETVAENYTDGVLSPLFWAALTGPVGLWVLKGISTLDSMVGYRNPRYHAFGTASARADDLVHFLPARLSLLCIALAAPLAGASARESLRIGLRDRLRHPSPNSAHSESAFAGALRLQLGGTSSYRGQPSHKPLLGDGRNTFGPEDVHQALRLLRWSTWTAWLFCAPLCLCGFWGWTLGGF